MGRTSIVEWVVLAVSFVATGGTVATGWGKEHKILTALATAVAIIIAGYFYRDRFFEWFGHDSDACANATEHWKSTERIGTLAAFDDHLSRFPTCSYAGLSQQKIESLKNRSSSLPGDAPAEIKREPYADLMWRVGITNMDDALNVRSVDSNIRWRLSPGDQIQQIGEISVQTMADLRQTTAKHYSQQSGGISIRYFRAGPPSEWRTMFVDLRCPPPTVNSPWGPQRC
jgi:hypothetical protein